MGHEVALYQQLGSGTGKGGTCWLPGSLIHTSSASGLPSAPWRKPYLQEVSGDSRLDWKFHGIGSVLYNSCIPVTGSARCGVCFYYCCCFCVLRGTLKQPGFVSNLLCGGGWPWTSYALYFPHARIIGSHTMPTLCSAGHGFVPSRQMLSTRWAKFPASRCVNRYSPSACHEYEWIIN